MNQTRNRRLSLSLFGGAPAALLRVGVVLSLVLAVLATSVLSGPGRGAAQDDLAATTGGLQGIAHGVATVPGGADGGEAAWRVILDQAPATDDSTGAERDLGFVLAEDAPVLVETTGGARDLLGPGTAAFVADGATDTRSGTDGVTDLYRIELVAAAEASDSVEDGNELLLGGDAFAAPTGDRLLSLDRVTLAPGAVVTAPESAAGPTVILATAGNLEVIADADGSANPVVDGTVIQLFGTGTISAAEGATVVIATIGDEVAASANAPAATATAAPSTAATPAAGDDSTPTAGTDGEAPSATSGLLAISVLDCSGGSLLDTTTCAPIPGVALSLVTDGSGSALVADDAGLASQEIAVGSTVTLSDPTGVPAGLVALNLPFAVDQFPGDYDLPIVFSLPNPTPETTPSTGGETGGETPTDPATAGTPVADDGTSGGGTGETAPTALVTIEALDCTRGEASDLSTCVAMPNATFSVTAGDATTTGEAGYTTDSNGYVSFTAPQGAAVTATYAFGAPTGIAPNNDGQVIEAIATDTTLTFVFVQVGGPLG